MTNITIFTDGASRGNPGPGGWGALTVVGDTITELGGRDAKTTNNRMELTAALKALQSLEKTDKKVVLYSDSSYVVNGITKWVHGWINNGWKTKDNNDVLNKDLWKALVTVVQDFDIDWQNVAGHSGVKGNERVDEIATSFADDAPTNLYCGEKELYRFDVFDLGEEDTESAKKARSKAKAYSYVSCVDGEILTHKTWKECEDRVKGKSNVMYRKALDTDDEVAIIAEMKAKCK